MSRFTSSPFLNVESSFPEVDSVLRSRFNTVAIQPGTVSREQLTPVISVPFGGESLGRETLQLPDMKGEGLTRQGLGQHPVDQSGKSLSVPVVMDSVVYGGGILGRSSSVLPFDDDAFGMECSDFAHSALSSRLRTQGNISTPSRYDAFVKTTPLGPRPATLVRLFLVPLGFVKTTLCGGRIEESNLQACISSTL